VAARALSRVHTARTRSFCQATFEQARTDLDMIQIYALENATQHGNTGTALAESVADQIHDACKPVRGKPKSTLDQKPYAVAELEHNGVVVDHACRGTVE
jgi:hypothetical protein